MLLLSSLRLFCSLILTSGFARALFTPNYAAPLLPAQDPFYSPPAGYESTAPGTVLKSRTINPAILGMIPTFLSSETYQILYRTTAVDGKPIATVTTVFIPQNAARDRMVAFDVFEDSSASQCAPSYNFQLAATSTNLLVQINILLIQAYLLKGWIVAAPDHQGPDSAFGAGRLAGMAVLDGIRAVQSFTPVGLLKGAKVVGSGYSGGAIATGWAASLKSTYANELNVVGWAMGGTPANLTGTFVQIDKALFTGFLPAAIVGLTTPSAYPKLQTLIDEMITLEGKSALQFAKSHCAVEDILKFAYQSFQSSKITSLGDQMLYHPTVVEVLSDNLMGKNKAETPTAPVFMYHSIDDEVIPYSNLSTLVKTWCNNGASIQLNSYSQSGHLGMSIRAIMDILAFTEDSFNGKTSKTCFERSMPMTPFALPTLLEPILVGLLNILRLIGNDDSGIMSKPQVLQTTVSTTVAST